jgi:single-stranded DNA-binding protein
VTGLFNLVVLAGRLLRPMSCERSPAGDYVCRLTLELEGGPPGAAGRGEWIDIWYVARRPDDVPPDLRVGDLVVAQGRLQIRRYRDRDGRARSAPSVLAGRLASADGGSRAQGGPPA